MGRTNVKHYFRYPIAFGIKELGRAKFRVSGFKFREEAKQQQEQIPRCARNDKAKATADL